MNGFISLARIAIVVGWTILLSGVAEAVAVRQEVERMELDWGSHKVRYFGAADADSGSYKEAEHSAWQDGLNYVMKAAKDLNVQAYDHLIDNPDRLAKQANAAAEAISSATYSLNTTYYSNGGIKVHLEANLPKLFATQAIRFRQKEAPAPGFSEFTGVLLALDKSMSPTPTYQIVDEKGNPLFTAADMAREAFEKNLMGRWYKRPTKEEELQAVGQNPVRVQVQVKGSNQLVVSRAEWQKLMNGHQGLLVSGQIALALP